MRDNDEIVKNSYIWVRAFDDEQGLDLAVVISIDTNTIDIKYLTGDRIGNSDTILIRQNKSIKRATEDEINSWRRILSNQQLKKNGTVLNLERN